MENPFYTQNSSFELTFEIDAPEIVGGCGDGVAAHCPIRRAPALTHPNLRDVSFSILVKVNGALQNLTVILGLGLDEISSLLYP